MDILADDFFEDGMSAPERRAEDQRTKREADDIEADITRNGPLGKYIQLRRRQAIAALVSLAETDPANAVGIAVLQAEIREYIRCCAFVTDAFTAADMAAQALQEELGTDHDEGSN